MANVVKVCWGARQSAPLDGSEFGGQPLGLQCYRARHFVRLLFIVHLFQAAQISLSRAEQSLVADRVDDREARVRDRRAQCRIA